MKYLESLNDAQKRAVLAIHGPLLIVAGAGSGKTKTLAHRILHIIHEGYDPKSILAITFTNKAAGEMRERVRKILADHRQGEMPVSDLNEPVVATFHSWGVKFLREFGKVAGISPSFVIYDKSDALGTVKDVLARLGLTGKEHEPAKYLHLISFCKNRLISPESHGKNSNDYTVKVFEGYEAALRQDNALDFDDLLVKTLEILRKHEEVRKELAKRIQFIHIDEYQDTNEVQYEIAKILGMPTGNICVVGDMDQSIYSWRGANMKNILRFEDDFKDTTVIELGHNYRSTGTIVEASESLIKKNVIRKEKNTFTTNPIGDQIELRESWNEREETREIMEKAMELMRGGVLGSEIAILYRTNFQSRLFEEFALNMGIKYTLVGTRFFERKEVKDVISYLRFAFAEETIADLKRITATPPRGIGKASLAKLVMGQKDLPGKAGAGYAELLGIMKNLREKATEGMVPSELVKETIESSGLHTFYDDKTEDGQERIENMEELASVAKRFDHVPGKEGMMELLAYAALGSDQDELEDANDGIRLMTIHAAKGLEFDVVFIPGLEEELLPHARSTDAKNEDLEEERRLMYVALTRARKKVFLSYTMLRTMYGAETVRTPSRFINEIDEHLITRVGSAEEPRGVKAIFGDF